MSETTKLLPCPFCGGAMQPRDALWPSEGDTDGVIHAGPTDCPLGEFSVHVADEGKSVAEAWNKRADSAELSRLRDEVEAWKEREQTLDRMIRNQADGIINLRNELSAAERALAQAREALRNTRERMANISLGRTPNTHGQDSPTQFKDWATVYAYRGYGEADAALAALPSEPPIEPVNGTTEGK